MHNESNGKVPPKKSWSVPTVSIGATLKTTEGTVKASDGAEIPIGDMRYTILDTAHVYHDKQILSELFKATGQPPKFLACFRPHRVALHLLTVSISTTLEVEHEEELRQRVEEIYFSQKFKNLLDQSYARLEKLRSTIEHKLGFLSYEELVNDDPGSQLTQEEREAIRNAIESVDKEKCIHLLGQHVHGFDWEAAIKILALDSLHRKTIHRELESLIEKIVHEYAVEKNITFLRFVPPEEMCEFMISGGQASGKGSSFVKVKDFAEHGKNIPWKQVVKVNTDSYKPLILDKKSVRPELYSQLAQEEASLIHMQIQQKIGLLAQQGKGIHHFFVDQVFVGKDKIDLAVECGGSAYITIVSTEVSVAIERAYSRGEQEGRFENTQGILGCHKNMTAQAVDVLSQFGGKKVYVELLDNNVERGDDPIPVMHLNLCDRTGVVHNPEMLERFAKKMTINVNATSSENLYSGAPVSTESYLSPLLKVGVNIQNMGQRPNVSELRQRHGL